AAATAVGGAGFRRATRLQHLPEAEDVVAVLLCGAVLPRVGGRGAPGRVPGVVDVRHTLPPVACGLLLRDGLDEPGGGLDLALHVADERARVHADALHGGVGHPHLGQDVVAALGQVDVAVAVTPPGARRFAGDDGRKQVGGDAVAGCGGVDGALRVGERPARNRAHVGEGAAHAL